MNGTVILLLPLKEQEHFLGPSAALIYNFGDCNGVGSDPASLQAGRDETAQEFTELCSIDPCLALIKNLKP